MDVVLIGAGGHGKVVLDILRVAGKHKPVGFVDANPALTGTTVAGLPVLGQINFLHKLKTQKVKGAIVSIGNNRIRRSYAKMVLDEGLELIQAIHPASTVSSSAKLGRNVMVAAGAVVGPEAVIEDSAIINTSAVVDHECRVEEAVHICPGVLLAGRVRIGAGAFIGMGSKILPCLTVGAGAIVGAGAVILADLPAGATAVGVPAKVIKTATPA